MKIGIEQSKNKNKNENKCTGNVEREEAEKKNKKIADVDGIDHDSDNNGVDDDIELFIVL